MDAKCFFGVFKVILIKIGDIAALRHGRLMYMYV